MGCMIHWDAVIQRIPRSPAALHKEGPADLRAPKLYLIKKSGDLFGAPRIIGWASCDEAIFQEGQELCFEGQNSESARGKAKSRTLNLYFLGV